MPKKLTTDEKKKIETQQLERARHNMALLYAASAEKARQGMTGTITITQQDLERVSNDLDIQNLLDERDDYFAQKRRSDVDYKTQIRQGRLKAAQKKGTHTHKEWIALLEEFDYRCLRCGCRFEKKLTKDHIIPLGMGGSDAIDNIQPLCRQCNSSSGGAGHSYNWIEWRRANGFSLGTDCFCWMQSICRMG